MSELENLSPAERLVLEELDTGEFTLLGGGELPKVGDEGRRVRASLIRLLMLCDDPEYRLHEKGLLIQGAWITGPLDLSGCRNLRDIGLNACAFDHAPDFCSAEISDVFLKDSRLPGLLADRIETRGGIFLGGVEASGEVRLLGAKVGQILDCDDAVFKAQRDADGNSGDALSADWIDVQGSVLLRNVKATGDVRLLGAKLGGGLECDGASFHAQKDVDGNPGDAFSADWLEVRGALLLRQVNAVGQVRLLGVKVGAELECDGASFSAQKNANGEFGRALLADGLETRGDVFLRDVESYGEIDMAGITVGGDLNCDGASLSARPDRSGRSRTALGLGRSRISGGFFLRDEARIVGVLDLGGAEVGQIYDKEACWPSKGDLVLDRCEYGAFRDSPVDAEARLRWLGLQASGLAGDQFWPQPYEQCAKVLREMGHRSEAQKVLIQKERLQREARRAEIARDLQGARENLTALKSANSASEDKLAAAYDPVWTYWWRLNLNRAWDGLVGATLGYGRAPQRAAIWAIAFLLVGWFVFLWAGGHGAMKPNNPVILLGPEWSGCAELDGSGRLECFLTTPEAASYPKFNAFIYSADTLLPVVSLEMQDHWIPDEDRTRGKIARWYLWVHIAVGWALSLLAVAGFSGLVKSD